MHEVNPRNYLTDLMQLLYQNQYIVTKLLAKISSQKTFRTKTQRTLVHFESSFCNLQHMLANLPRLFCNLQRGLANLPRHFCNLQRMLVNLTRSFCNLQRMLANLPRYFCNLQRMLANLPRSFCNLQRMLVNLPRYFCNLQRMLTNLSRLRSIFHKLFQRHTLPPWKIFQMNSAKPISNPKSSGDTDIICIKSTESTKKLRELYM